MKGFQFYPSKEVEDVWCPTTKYQTWVAVHPETNEPFITGNSSPNLAQLPQGAYFRKLFTPPPGWDLVGADLANIEIRVLAHYLAEYDDGAYAKQVLSKDMHWYHAKVAGFWTKDDRDWPSDAESHLRTSEMKQARKLSKAFFFGYLYGQGNTIRGFNLLSNMAIRWTNVSIGASGVLNEENTKYMDIEFTSEEYKLCTNNIKRRLNDNDLFPLKKDEYVEMTDRLIVETIYGKQVAETFIENMTGIKELINDCKAQHTQKSSITAIDGRELYSVSGHSALNTLLQGTAGILAKQWIINTHEVAVKNGLIYGKDWYQSVFVHDETQNPCRPSKTKLLGISLINACLMIQKQFSLNLLIECDYDVGQTWADTH